MIGLEGLNQIIDWLKKRDDIEGFMFKEIDHLFASKACRGSIMIGDSLSRPRMKTLVSKLAGFA